MSINAATGGADSVDDDDHQLLNGRQLHRDPSEWVCTCTVAAEWCAVGFIQVFSVDQRRSVDSDQPEPSPGRSCIAVDANGEFMYVTNSGDNTVSTYSISQNGGALRCSRRIRPGFQQAVALIGKSDCRP